MRPWIVLAVAVSCLLAAAGRASAQGLGDAASRERKRREAVVKQRGPARVLTDRDANPGGAWVGWRDFQPPDGAFTIQMPSRPTEERDEVELLASGYSVSRVYYHARDENAWEFWLFVIDYPADYVRRNEGRIRSDFPMQGLLPYESNDTFVQTGSQLAGREIQVLWGRRQQVVACLIGTRYYHLMAKTAPGEYFDHRELHPFIKSFRP
jgi:hypothetical protein